MNCIELMISEHKNIKRMLKTLRKMCYGVLKGVNPDEDDFRRVIDFVKNYADGHHHRKEEDLLFVRMVEELKSGPAKFIRNGMLVEHDLGRLYIKELEEALDKVLEGDDESRLDLIGNAVSYCSLLNRHIDKEDNVLYKYALNNLAPESLKELNDDCIEVENKSDIVKYIDTLNYLENKYMIISQKAL